MTIEEFEDEQFLILVKIKENRNKIDYLYDTIASLRKKLKGLENETDIDE